MLNLDAISFGVLYVLNCLTLYFFFFDKSAWKVLSKVLVPCAAIYYTIFGWHYAATDIHLTILVIAMTYGNFLLSARNTSGSTAFRVKCVMLTAFLTMTICVAFGAWYSNNYYSTGYAVDLYDWKKYPAMIQKFMILGFREFFVSLDHLTIWDVHVFQRFVGCILSLVIIPLVASVINNKPRKGG